MHTICGLATVFAVTVSLRTCVFTYLCVHVSVHDCACVRGGWCWSAGEMLLTGDGQLHEGDWGGIGEDGEYEAGDGDEANESMKSMSRSTSRNQLSTAVGRSPAPQAAGRGGGAAAGRGGGAGGGGGAGVSAAAREALNEHVLSLEEENVSLRALTRSLMNERHDLLSSLDSTNGEVVHLRRICSTLQSKLLSAGRNIALYVRDRARCLRKRARYLR